MKMKNRLLAIAGVATLALGLSVGTANAVDPGCKTVVANITDRPDSGEDGNHWAKDTFSRTVKVCEKEDTPGTYTASGQDQGTFTGVEGEETPGGGDSATLPADVVGTFSGSWTATLKAQPGFTTLNDNDDKSLDVNTLSTSEWVLELFTDADVEGSLDSWGWTYTTTDCDGGILEKWVNADAGNSGNITQAPPGCTTTGDSGVTAGSYLVPDELAPGLYKTTVPENEEFGCGVVRYGDTGRDDVLGGVGLTETGQAGVLEVKESDVLVEFTGSCVWHLDSSGTGNGTGNGGGGSGDSDDSDGLPVTGSNLILLIIVGMASATLGTIAVVIGRRKGVV